MPVSNLPTDLFASLALTDTDTKVSIPLASIPQLTAAEANPTTGDSRKLLFAMMEQVYAWWIAKAVADRPTAVTISRSTMTNETTGVMTKTYSIAIQISATAVEVITE